MKKKDMSELNYKDEQVEFFSDLPGISKESRKTKFNLAKIAVSLSYENIIILTIGLIMLLITCYSLGVEKGRGLVQNKTKDSGIVQEQRQKTTRIPSPAPKKMETKLVSKKYTIQVATFNKPESVKREVKRLKSKGYLPFVIRQGKLYEICVGSYQSKSKASRKLKELRKTYSDCYLRKK